MERGEECERDSKKEGMERKMINEGMLKEMEREDWSMKQGKKEGRKSWRESR